MMTPIQFVATVFVIMLVCGATSTQAEKSKQKNVIVLSKPEYTHKFVNEQNNLSFNQSVRAEGTVTKIRNELVASLDNEQTVSLYDLSMCNRRLNAKQVRDLFNRYYAQLSNSVGREHVANLPDGQLVIKLTKIMRPVLCRKPLECIATNRAQQMRKINVYSRVVRNRQTPMELQCTNAKIQLRVNQTFNVDKKISRKSIIHINLFAVVNQSPLENIDTLNGVLLDYHRKLVAVIKQSTVLPTKEEIRKIQNKVQIGQSLIIITYDGFEIKREVLPQPLPESSFYEVRIVKVTNQKKVSTDLVFDTEIYEKKPAKKDEQYSLVIKNNNGRRVTRNEKLRLLKLFQRDKLLIPQNVDKEFVYKLDGTTFKVKIVQLDTMLASVGRYSII